MKKLIIFGIGEQAELAYFYFKSESDYQVCGFTVDQAFIKKDCFLDDLPLIPFEEIENYFPPDEYIAFVAIGYSKVNQIRAEKYQSLKSKGYNFASFVSGKATNYAESIGENCFILEDNTIQPFVRIGNNVTLWSGNHIGHHSVIEDHCFITSQVVISGGCRIGEASFIGVNATLRDHIFVGKKNVIGAASNIMNNTDDESVYIADKTLPKKVKSSRLKVI